MKDATEIDLKCTMLAIAGKDKFTDKQKGTPRNRMSGTAYNERQARKLVLSGKISLVQYRKAATHYTKTMCRAIKKELENKK